MIGHDAYTEPLTPPALLIREVDRMREKSAGFYCRMEYV